MAVTQLIKRAPRHRVHAEHVTRNKSQKKKIYIYTSSDNCFFVLLFCIGFHRNVAMAMPCLNHAPHDPICHLPSVEKPVLLLDIDFASIHIESINQLLEKFTRKFHQQSKKCRVRRPLAEGAINHLLHLNINSWSLFTNQVLLTQKPNRQVQW